MTRFVFQGKVRSLNLFLGAFLICVSAVDARANILTPLEPPQRLDVDEHTVGLFRIDRQAIETGRVGDVSGRTAGGRLEGKWECISPAEVRPTYEAAGRALSADDGHRARVVFDGLDAALKGGLSVDVVLRWSRAGGTVICIGTAPETLQLAVQQRGPGILELRVPVKTDSGRVETEILASDQIYHGVDVGPVSFAEFYTYSLTFDGNKTFSLFIDGRKVFEGAVTKGEVHLPGGGLVVGDGAPTGSHFKGDLAAVRVTRGVRRYTAQSRLADAFAAAKTVRIFDAGPTTKPARARVQLVGPNDRYSADRGYGWLQETKGTFDSWYSPNRWQHDPHKAFAEKTYKIHDALTRDGVQIEKNGEFFRADVPDGLYWVQLGIGNAWGEARVTRISANDTLLGEDLWTRGNTSKSNTPTRVARGLVRASGKGGIVISGTSASGGIPVESISILEYAPLPVEWKNGEVRWNGDGPAPPAIGAVSRSLAAHDLDGAVRAAEAVEDSFVHACVLAVITGQPKLPVASDLALVTRTRELLVTALRENPANAGARWLFDSNERLRHTMYSYLDESGDEIVYGNKYIIRVILADVGMSMRPTDPGYYQGRFIAAAAIWQAAVQGSAFGKTSDEYLPDRGAPAAFAAPGKVFREIIAAYPEVRIARIMLGEKLPSPSNWTAPANTPKWAALQYELLQRVMETCRYWVEQRMDANGLLGGGLGDDVEALRWWGPAVTLADDKIVIAGYKRLSEAAWRSTKGKGFALTLQDVEHSAEDISDSQPMLGLIEYGTKDASAIRARLTKMQPTFRDVWTGVTPDGHRMFKGHFLSATEVGRDGDVPYNIRAIRPLLWGAWTTPDDKELRSLLVAYASSWRDAIMSEFDGKPRGIAPMMIRWDRKTAKQDAGDGRSKLRLSWYAPGYGSYAYPGGYVDKVYDVLLAGYEMSGDPSLLEPIKFGLEALREMPDSDRDPSKYAAGSFEWAIRAGIDIMGMAGANYRMLTGDTSYDDILVRISPPHSQFMMGAERAKGAGELATAAEPLLKKLQTDLAEMNTNPELRTTMVQSTDRIYVCGTRIIDSMSTGVTNGVADLRGSEVVWPTYQVTWKGTEGKVAVLLKKATPDRLTILLYNFADKPLHLTPRVWRLKPGAYEISLLETDGTGLTGVKQLAHSEAEVTGAGFEIGVDVPSQVPLELSLVRK